MQHKGVVQPLVRAKTRLTANMVIFFMDLRRLRESGLLLVHRLSDKNARVVFIEIQQQRRGIRHHVDKLFVAHPGGIKQNVVTQVADFVHHLTRVVNGAVVSPQLNNRQPEWTRGIGLLRRHFTDEFAQIGVIEAVFINPADKTERVARSLQIDRRRPSLNERTVVVGFVVIAVKQHQIATGQQRVGHPLCWPLTCRLAQSRFCRR
ncbi:Uncharacterised protein [Kluyvera cryocrescens]|uniref:Uncharacterized protein n=1 Tax=Kluyvera cryocrescens TaxID=580 RepID=A0A485ARF2_KLUCR|nr:Uncharacterised protein [Kluyvera cryocrescens]